MPGENSLKRGNSLVCRVPTGEVSLPSPTAVSPQRAAQQRLAAARALRRASRSTGGLTPATLGSSTGAGLFALLAGASRQSFRMDCVTDPHAAELRAAERMERYVALVLSQNEEDEVKHLYDRCGPIQSVARVAEVLASVGQHWPEEDVAAVCADSNFAREGVMSLRTLKYIMAKVKTAWKATLVDDVTEAFQALANGGDSVAADNFRVITKQFHLTVDVERMLLEADADGSGLLELQEFHDMIESVGARDSTGRSGAKWRDSEADQGLDASFSLLRDTSISVPSLTNPQQQQQQHGPQNARPSPQPKLQPARGQGGNVAAGKKRTLPTGASANALLGSEMMDALSQSSGGGGGGGADEEDKDASALNVSRRTRNSMSMHSRRGIQDGRQPASPQPQQQQPVALLRTRNRSSTFDFANIAELSASLQYPEPSGTGSGSMESHLPGRARSSLAKLVGSEGGAARTGAPRERKRNVVVVDKRTGESVRLVLPPLASSGRLSRLYDQCAPKWTDPALAMAGIR